MPNDTKHGASGTDSRALMDSWTHGLFKSSANLHDSFDVVPRHAEIRRALVARSIYTVLQKTSSSKRTKVKFIGAEVVLPFFTSSETFRMTYHDIPTESNCTIQIVFTSFYLPTDLMILGNRRWKNITEAPETASLYVLRMPQKHGTGSIGTSLPITPMDWFNRKWAGKIAFLLWNIGISCRFFQESILVVMEFT